MMMTKGAVGCPMMMTVKRRQGGKGYLEKETEGDMGGRRGSQDPLKRVTSFMNGPLCCSVVGCYSSNVSD